MTTRIPQLFTISSVFLRGYSISGDDSMLIEKAA